MTFLHARLEVLEGALAQPVTGAAGVEARTFVLLSVEDEEGRVGMGEASPLPGYSPDSTDEVIDALQTVLASPIEVDPLLPARALLDHTAEVQLMPSPSARFAIEAALLDWLGRVRNAPVHAMLGDSPVESIPVADLVNEPDPRRWLDEVDTKVRAGWRYLKFKAGSDWTAEVEALTGVRAAHPTLGIRVDANQKLALSALEDHREELLALRLDFFEEPVPSASLGEVAKLSLPLAIDETLRDEAPSRAALATGAVRALVIKPTVVGGLTAALDLAKIARAHGAEPVLSHTFDGPVARAASAEVALAVGATLAQGLGEHACLSLWPPAEIASIQDFELRSHRVPGLGVTFGGRGSDA
ncbi:MAG: mandelate racemase/muconate lactonizing enzyme family protein [Myxococcota bacterium]